MALSPGTRLGPYEILSALGAGGMGEVYKARDTRLDRSVAIKVLKPDIAGDPDLRERFEREARAVAALDHPHICGIYDVGEAGGTHFIVMPHLDGETLAARLEQAPLPLDQALKIAVEIADALDKAHRHGITHRDLKPANIMLVRVAGTSRPPDVKLLDFGLAKLRGPAAPISMSGMTRLATAPPNTSQGTILGTVHYMAPEQVEGRDADARTDIWALGVVIYEMATGKRPFEGQSPASIIGAILKDAPPPMASRQPARAADTRSHRQPVSRQRCGRSLAVGTRCDARAPIGARGASAVERRDGHADRMAMAISYRDRPRGSRLWRSFRMVGRPIRNRSGRHAGHRTCDAYYPPTRFLRMAHLVARRQALRVYLEP